MSRERPRRGTLPPAQENIYKLEKVVNAGDFYEAQQMYKSISARYITAERYPEALEILKSGACIQLKHGQITCGSELGVLFVNALVKGKFPCNDEMLDLVRKIYKMFPRISLPQHLGEDVDMQKLSEALGEAKTRVECCSTFLKAAIKWSAEFGSYTNGVPELHIMLADYIYSESVEVDMVKVSFHFIRGNEPKKFAATIVNFMGKCYPDEDDLAIARAILMYLALGNLRDANILMDEIKEQVNAKQLEFPDSDLTEFISYLLPTLERDALPLFNMLKQTYKLDIDREPAFNDLLDEIAAKFYGVRRKNALEGIFGDLFKAMG